jgi:iron complex outermembrane receptor protein
MNRINLTFMAKLYLGFCDRAVVALLMATVGQTVVAASSDSSATGDTSQSNEIPEVIVTAQRRSESLQNVPIAITVVTPDAMKADGINDAQDLPLLVPSMVTVDVAAVFLPFIRGIGSTSSQDGFESSVAVYVDGVYLANKSAILFDFNNIQSIEILKGPQGTLFGRNATGGAINITTKDPGNAFTSEAEFGVGNYNSFSGNAYVSGPVSDTVSFNMAATVRQTDGYIHELVRNTTDGAIDAKGLMTKLKWIPGDNVSATLSLDYSEDSDNAAGAIHAVPGLLTGPQAAGYAVPTCNYCYAGQFDPIFETKNYGSAANIGYSLDGMKLVSISAYRGSEVTAYLPTDATEAPLSFAGATHFGREFTQELQLLSENDSRLEWITGLYYIHDQQGYNNGLNGLIVPLSEGITFPVNPDQLLSVKGIIANFNTAITTESEAAFVQGTYSFTPVDKLTAGIRYTQDKKIATGTLQLIGAAAAGPGADFTYTPVSSFGPDGLSTTYRKPTWRLAYDHAFSDDVMAYATYNRGYKSGSYSTAVVSPKAVAVNPETLDAYEIGLKSEFLQHRLRVNLAGYYYDYKNIQVAVIENSISSTQNAAAATAFGLDLDYELLLANAFSLTGGLNVNHSYYTSYPDASVYVPVAGGGATLAAINAAGDQLVYAPAATVTLGPNYEFPAGDGRLVLGASGYYNSGYNATPGGIGTHVGSYSDLGASATWHAPKDRFYVRLWGQNLLSEHHAIWFQTGSDGFHESLARPATYGVKFGYKY